MANWSNPTLASTYTNFVTEVKDRDVEVALWFEGMSPTNLPTNAKRLNTTNGRFEKWNGSTWVDAVATFTFPALTVAGATTLSDGTANGVTYLNGSKVLTSGSALTFDGTNLKNTTSAGGVKLEIVSTSGSPEFSLTSADTGLSQINFGGTTAPKKGKFVYSDNSDLFYWVLNSSSEQMRLTSTGLGIGTSSPATKLHVTVSAASTAVAAFYNTDTADGNGVYIKAGGLNSGKYALAIDNAASSSLLFLDSSGNLGIGTSSPLSKLHVNGDIRTDGDIDLIGGAGTPEIRLYQNGGNWAVQNVTGSLIFRDMDQSADRVSIDSSGNLGLGVTPSAWSTFTSVLQTKQSSLFSYNGNTYLYSNYYYDGSPRYMTNNEAMGYAQENGAHAWYTAPSGTAGNAISFTQAMTLYASGGLSVGNTSDPGAKTINLGFHNGTGSLVGGLHFTGYAAGYGAGIRSYTDTSPGVDYQDLRFYTAAGPSFPFTERARITSGGDFGIGTESPSAKLHVSSGAANEVMRLEGTGDPFFSLYDSGTRQFYIQSTSTVVNAYADQTKELFLSTLGSADLKLGTAGVTRLTVLAAGNTQVSNDLAVLGNLSVNNKTAYVARAWVNFNGTGTVAIRASGNVTSITDNGTGTYTVNFTSAMTDANYSVALSTGSTAWGFGAHIVAGSNGGTPTTMTTSALRISTSSDGGSQTDSSHITVSIFR